MDNNMLAVLSFIMISIGFTQGCIVTRLVGTKDVDMLNEKLSDTVDDLIDAEDEIEQLKEQLNKEKQEKEDILKKLRCILSTHILLPPPSETLERSAQCCGSQYSNVSYPGSPDVTSDNKD